MTLKLFNSRNRRKEDLLAIATDKRFKLFPASTLIPAADEEETDFTGLRVEAFLVWLRAALRHHDCRLDLVESADEADAVLVAGEKISHRFVISLGETDPDVDPAELIDYSQSEINYWLLAAHYRTALPGGTALEAGATALDRLREYVREYQARVKPNGSFFKPATDPVRFNEWRTRFYDQLDDDLNLPGTLTICWTMLQSELDALDKLRLLADFDRTLDLDLGLPVPQKVPEKPILPEPPKSEKPSNPVTGYEGAEGQPHTKEKKPPKKEKKDSQHPARPEKPSGPVRRVSGSKMVRSFLRDPDLADFTVSLVNRNNLAELQASLESLLKFSLNASRKIEILVVDLASEDGSEAYLENMVASYRHCRVVYAEDIGEAAARNIAFKQARGKWLLLLDTGITLKAELFGPLFKQMNRAGEKVLGGLYPLKLDYSEGKITGFSPASEGEPDALDGSFFCFRRSLVDEVGFMDEHFRLPYALDLDYSYAFKDKGFELAVLPGLDGLVQRSRPVGQRPDFGLTPELAERQRQKNWHNFLRSWDLS